MASDLKDVVEQLNKISSSIKAQAAAAGAGPSRQVATSAAGTAQPTNTGGNQKIQNYEQQSKDLLKEMKAVFEAATQNAFPGLTTEVEVSDSDPKWGDYQCNIAMKLFGQLKGKPGAPKSPRDVASLIMENMPKTSFIDQIKVSGPGFLTVTLNTDWLQGHIKELLQKGADHWAPKLPYKKVAVDFSSPNVAKEMHVGHLRSTIIGDSLSRMFEYCGVETLRLNHIGDWGTQFGMLIQHMSESTGGLQAAGSTPVSDLQILYRESKKRFDEDETFKTNARQMVTRLQGGDKDVLKAWERICDASRLEFNKIYTRLDIKLTERGESFYNPLLPDLVQHCLDEGVAQVEEGGAVVIYVSEDENVPPLMIRKSDGGYGYASTDLAAVRHRLFEEKCDRIMYVVDSGQQAHFSAVFEAARKLGWLPRGPGKASHVTTIPSAEHVAFGLVLGEDGGKIKTRSGQSVRLVELLDEAVTRVTAIMDEKAPKDASEQEIAEIIQVMSHGAVKYADLKGNRISDYKFSFDQLLQFNGNTAVYLLYAHARIAGIGRKSSHQVSKLIQSPTDVVALKHPAERALANHIAKFPHTVYMSVQEMLPNRVCTYVYELCEVYNVFYDNCKVIGSEDEVSRLLLCEATAVIIRQCFKLLGLKELYRL